MKKFNLKNTKVSNLNEIDLEELKKYLKLVSLRERVEFIIQVMDTEYTLCERNEKAEKFIANLSTPELRDIILRVIGVDEFGNEFTAEDWIKIEKDERMKKIKNIKKISDK
jgi:hypothetical protein